MTTELNATVIRRAVPDDVTACAEVIHGWATQTKWMPDELQVEELSVLIRDAFDSREIWVAGDPVDCYMSVDPVQQKIGALFCRRTGQGIGKCFVDKAKEGRAFLWLTTHRPNVAAQRFYRREGFEVTAEEPPVPPDTVPVYRMGWHV
ncbi:GNAT family N-acetyltransferase [uncultured Ruegeria sp.]|uniref:GNAT family N-acetyltransferase n=1 Tax=uncultured Ruegeria sp. TaxID=259304 RepID=UPI00261710E3|nr:GNAT family N-acetyltransferase [uncultured Ruegeria sp.]